MLWFSIFAPFSVVYIFSGDLKDSLMIYFGVDLLFKNQYAVNDLDRRFKKILVLTVSVIGGDMVQFVCFH